MVTLQFVPYGDIEHLSSVGRIRKLLNIAKQDKIVLLQGRLSKEEETELIKTTMEEINKDFKGIELGVVHPSANSQPKNTGKALLNNVRSKMLNLLLGYREGLTIVGPASIVKEIKRDPEKIELLTKDINISTKKNRRRK